MDRASSLVGMSIRYAANSIILIKVIQISDLMLILGQGLLVTTRPQATSGSAPPIRTKAKSLL
jgi:hypothetical protein